MATNRVASSYLYLTNALEMSIEMYFVTYRCVRKIMIKRIRVLFFVKKTKHKFFHLNFRLARSLHVLNFNWRSWHYAHWNALQKRTINYVIRYFHHLIHECCWCIFIERGESTSFVLSHQEILQELSKFQKRKLSSRN